jgi:transposase
LKNSCFAQLAHFEPFHRKTSLFVKKGKKNDAADAAALSAAASQTDVKFVPAKTLEQQGILALHSARLLLVKQQTMLANAMRGLATEFGLTVSKGISKLGELLASWMRMRRSPRKHGGQSGKCSTTTRH